MERRDAISYLKEILDSTSSISPRSVTLEKNKDNNGYCIRIRVEIFDREVVRGTAQRHSLGVKEDEETIVVYKP